MRRTLVLLVFVAVIGVAVWYAVTHFERVPSTAEGGATPSPRADTPTVAVPSLPALGAACGRRCGKERWPVKTLSDRDRDRVVLTPVEATVEQLAVLPRPRRSPRDRRIAPVELTTYEVTGCLGVVPHAEADGDIHLVIGGLEDRRLSLIAEVPDPGCAGVCESGLGAVYVRVRATLDSLLAVGQPSPQCTNDVPLVTLVGVGFFDRAHGQIGAAPNHFELHPVLALRAR